jgi:hypothetical protein
VGYVEWLTPCDHAFQDNDIRSSYVSLIRLDDEHLTGFLPYPSSKRTRPWIITVRCSSPTYHFIFLYHALDRDTRKSNIGSYWIHWWYQFCDFAVFGSTCERASDDADAERDAFGGIVTSCELHNLSLSLTLKWFVLFSLSLVLAWCVSIRALFDAIMILMIP